MGMARIGQTAAVVCLLLAGCVTVDRETAVEPEGTAEPAVAESLPAERPYDSIAALVALGDAGRAIEEYEKLYRERPDDYETRLLYARLLVMAARHEEARSALGLLLQEAPDEPEALFLLALIEGIEGNQDRQRELLEAVLRADPLHADALSVLGDLLLAQNRVQEAKVLFDTAVGAEPDNTVALQGMATVALDEGDWAEATDLLTRVVEAEPDNVLALVDRARARREAGDRPGALEDLGTALALDPEYYWSYIDRAQIRIERNELEAAREDLDRAVRLDPGYFLGYVLRGQTLYRLGRIPEAGADFERITVLRPDYYHAYQPLATCRYIEERYADAAAAFLKAYDRQPGDPSLALLAALSMKKAGREADARRSMTTLAASLDRQSWQYEVARYYANPSNDFYIVSAANREKRPTIKYRLLFYLAAQHLLQNKKGSAMAYFAEVGELTGKLVFQVPSPEKLLAEWELERLQGKG